MAPDSARAFFGSKKPWSVQKDLILRHYLPPYLNKVLSWVEGRSKEDRPVLLADVFAGPGTFGDGSSPGSPLHIVEAAEQAAKGRYSAVFGNEDLVQHEQLVEVLKSYEHAHPRHEPSHVLLKRIREHVGDRALFVFIDPMGAFGYEYDLLAPLIERIKRGQSTELLINFFVNDIHRKSARDRFLEVGIGALSPAVRRRIDRLDRVLGGRWWRDVEYDPTLVDTQERSELIMEGYVARLKEAGFRYVARCPVRERDLEEPHYWLIHGSRSIEALKLMNETMGNVISSELSKRHVRERMPLFKEQMDDDDFIAWERGRTAAFRDLLVLIPELLERNGPTRRLDQWETIVQEHFLQFQKKEHTRAVKELYHRDVVGFEREDGSRRLRDDAILYLKRPSTGRPT